MSDRYLTFVNRPLGKWLSGRVGLPQPLPLQRYAEGKPELRTPVLVGGTGGARLTAALARVVGSVQAATLYHGENTAWPAAANAYRLMTGRFSGETSGRVGALVFDASGIAEPGELAAVYRFFHDTLRSVQPQGRVVVLGTPPELAGTLDAAIAQRALEGLTRALGKEARRAIAVQLVYVAPGAEDAIDSTLRFFLSVRSAYVSGQVVRISTPLAAAPPFDWSKSQAGRTAVVTGAARGIGAAIAEVFAREGAHVICVDVPQATADLEAVAQRLAGSALPLDITVPDAAAQIANAVGARSLDVLVHNAGITRDKTIVKMDEARWSSVLGVNLIAPLRITEDLLAQGRLGANARVIGVSSISGIAGNVGQTNYATSKAGVIGFVQSFAPLLAERGATINAVAPGFIETQMTAAIPLATREAGRRMNSMLQGGQPVDVAEAIAWFAHPASGGVNGNVVRVCGQSLIGA